MFFFNSFFILFGKFTERQSCGGIERLLSEITRTVWSVECLLAVFPRYVPVGMGPGRHRSGSTVISSFTTISATVCCCCQTTNLYRAHSHQEGQQQEQGGRGGQQGGGGGHDDW